MPLNFTYRRSSTFSAVAPERAIGQAMGCGFSRWRWATRPRSNPGSGWQVSAPSFAFGMALVVLGAGVLALLLREPVRRLMRVGRAVDPLTRPAGPGAGPRGEPRPVLADTVGAARPVRALVTPCPSVQPPHRGRMGEFPAMAVRRPQPHGARAVAATRQTRTQLRVIACMRTMSPS
jgi:hypothetical protein